MPKREPRPASADLRKLTEIMGRVVAKVLPPSEGMILVITAPPEMDWTNEAWVSKLQVAAESAKLEHGFAGVIITSHGTDIASMDAAMLARIGLMAIPGSHDMETRGEA